MYDHAEIHAISRPICLLEHQMQKCCSFKRVYLLNKKHHASCESTTVLPKDTKTI